MKNQLSNWVNTQQAAEIIGCTDGHVRRMLIGGYISGVKVSGRTWLVARKDAERMASTPAQTGRPRSRQA